MILCFWMLDNVFFGVFGSFLVLHLLTCWCVYTCRDADARTAGEHDDVIPGAADHTLRVAAETSQDPRDPRPHRQQHRRLHVRSVHSRFSVIIQSWQCWHLGLT